MKECDINLLFEQYSFMNSSWIKSRIEWFDALCMSVENNQQQFTGILP